MKFSHMPKAYIGKEQAYVKHTILKKYLQRLFMIVGKKEKIINYVDCFSGPWKEKNYDLSDTSIGISLEQMAGCQQTLKDVLVKILHSELCTLKRIQLLLKSCRLFFPSSVTRQWKRNASMRLYRFIV